MYEPRSPRARRPLKHRYTLNYTTPLQHSNFWTKNGWLTVMTLSPSIVPPRVIPRIYTYIKKMVRYPQTHTRFWVNAQCAYLVTRKPLNVRMGKGKGAKVRLYSYLKRNVPLAALTKLRSGLAKRLRRFITIRLGRPVQILRPTLVFPEWTQRHRVQTNFLRSRALEVKTLLLYIRRPAVKLFFNRLFRLAWRRPRLRWRSKWPLLPKISSRLRIRRKVWGSGAKGAAPVWAGLASLLNGVRRDKVAKNKSRLKLAKKANKEIQICYKTLKKNRLIFRTRVFKTKLLMVARLIYSNRLLTSNRPLAVTRFIPYTVALAPLWKEWSNLGFIPSEKERASFKSLEGGHPSLIVLNKTVSFLEKATLVMLMSFTEERPASAPAFVKGVLLKQDNDLTGGEGLLITFIGEEKAFEPWPSCPLQPLFLTYSTVNPILRAIAPRPSLCQKMPIRKSLPSSTRTQRTVAKYALFNVYLATLSLSSYPAFQNNSRLSSLRGLTTKRGHRCLNTQRWLWLIGPLWSAWGAWFDALVGVFLNRGNCIAYGPASLELVSYAFSWLTLGQTHRTKNFPLYPWGSLYGAELSKSFFILLGTPRFINLANQPVFSLSGSNVRNRIGWASLPGPDTNKTLHFFVLMATLAAYKIAKKSHTIMIQHGPFNFSLFYSSFA